MEKALQIALNKYEYIGPEMDDFDTFSKLPDDYQQILREKNGYIRFSGALHIRGCCNSPLWHSLQNCWTGELSLARFYPAIQDEDIPFAQNALGDQFILRNNIVHYMYGETGGLLCLNMEINEFLMKVEDDPLNYLNCWEIEMFLANGNQLKPGELLHAYPPLCTDQAANGISLTAVPMEQQIFANAQRIE